MSYNNILEEQQEAVLTITINRPDQLNALNTETIKELGQAMQAAEGNPSIKAIIITGSGEKA